MIAYKFLCAGGVGPFSRYRWPLPRDGAAGSEDRSEIQSRHAAASVRGP